MTGTLGCYDESFQYHGSLGLLSVFFPSVYWPDSARFGWFCIIAALLRLIPRLEIVLLNAIYEYDQ